MYKKLNLFYVFFLGIFFSPLLSQEIFEIKAPESPEIILGKYSEYLEDPNGELSFEEILHKNLKWNKLKNENVNFGYNQSFFWVRFTINNKVKNTLNPILEIPWSKQDYIEFYNLLKDKYEIQITGDIFPFANRKIDDTFFAFELEIPPESIQTYYIKTRSINNLSLLNPILHSSFISFHKESSFRNLRYGLLYGFLVIMIFYNLFLYIFLKEKVYLFLSIYISCFGFSLLSQHGIAFQYIYPNNTWLANRDGAIIIPILLIFQILFLNSYLELNIKLPQIHNFLNKFIFLLVFHLISLFTLFKDSRAFMYYSLLIIIFIENTFFLIIGIYLSFKKFRPAYFYLFSWSMFLPSVFLRVLSGMSLIPVNSLTFWSFPFGLSAMLVFISIGLADKINYLKLKLFQSNQKLENYSNTLEQNISIRTKELQQTLDTVNELKKQQDGDYFLTSLLLEPFTVNNGKSETLNIDFLIIQKKKFEFYGKEQNIGGDLCHTQNIILNNQKYILFFNSDAMGKSLQGAGGAIVFGSVIFSIIQRTKSNINLESTYPERWLKNAFIELHKVFLTFECTMLVSAVIGLIEEDTGLLYYINAEHPWLVLYKDKVSSFIEKEIYFTKLGSPVDSNKVFINLYQMKKNDIIFIGSDGKDDLIPMNSNQLDGTFIHEETEFLNTIDQAEGNLSKIYDITTQKGKITDDFSLVRIKFLGNGEDRNYNHLKEISKEKFKNNNIQECLTYGHEYTMKNPSDTDFLLFLGNVYKSLDKHQNALTYFERVRLRNPYHLENLILLINTYIAVKNKKKAEKILNDFISLNPEDPQIAQLKNDLAHLSTL